MGMEDLRTVKKLASYVNADMFIEETTLGRSWSFLCDADVEDMEELEREAYEDYIREPGMTAAEWAAENDVDWEAVEDKRMN
jgi:hypothetical protein